MLGNDLDPRLDELVRAVCASAKYAQLSQTLVRRIAVEELQNQGSLPKAVKTTRARLHQLAGAYLAPKLNYAQWLEKFQALPANDIPALKATSAAVMRLHHSTAERLPFLDAFYQSTLRSLEPISSVLDLACGLNPLAIPWMPLAENFTYEAVDVVAPMLSFIASYFELLGIQGRTSLEDLSSYIPKGRAQLVLMLKLMPLLDQIDKSLGRRLLVSLDADHILVSYPLRSLGGHSKGMDDTYTRQFETLISGLSFHVDTFEFPNEKAFLLSR